MFLYITLYIIYGRIYDAFQVSVSRIQDMVYSQFLAEFITNAIIFIVLWIALDKIPDLMICLTILLSQLMISVIWSFTVHKWYFRTHRAKRIAVIYDTEDNLNKFMQEYGNDKKFEIAKCYEIHEVFSKIDELSELDAIFYNGVRSHERNIILKYCIKNNIASYIIPRIGDVLMSGSHQMHMYHLPILLVTRYNPSPEYLFLKRAMDVIISSLGIIVLSPVFLIVGLAVMSDGGPALYKQTRLTKDGREFEVLKFRSMKVDAEKDGVARLSTGENDSRITKVGRVIRMVRLDEIPQLFNFLKGDMSIVGPRPERPEIASEYEKTIPEFNLRLQTRAGLTGYAQVYGKYNTTPYDKLLMDLTYIANPSFLEDIRICFATVKILFQKDSTEGVSS